MGGVANVGNIVGMKRRKGIRTGIMLSQTETGLIREHIESMSIVCECGPMFQCHLMMKVR